MKPKLLPRHKSTHSPLTSPMEEIKAIVNKHGFTAVVLLASPDEELMISYEFLAHWTALNTINGSIAIESTPSDTETKAEFNARITRSAKLLSAFVEAAQSVNITLAKAVKYIHSNILSS